MITTRQARAGDALAMCDVINPIIREGSTTAHRSEFDAERMCATHIDAPRLIRTTLAFDGDDLLGFQLLEWADPDYDGPEALPDDWAVIASFVRSGLQGRGVGQVLWRDTLLAAKRANVRAIDASIRTDNEPGLAYYAKLGFRDYSSINGMVLSDGTVVDKTRKRFDIA
ncbi:GNAT family acetyltransferase [Aliiroseovarius zhejiangensis]|uniref:GNAT family acetyltransferase n=1 Tax=Aliiroseovarius zhejiangensis TaxID=1632025 RepID=A0ABQ3J5K8_9RHOB|nr:GNAT family N-acetyltransferase [Aliiroseovarius zhejiangensis]GHF02223.1 GNAT family acetyltransferase [Aliiroseovarius zhejiangensis]